MRQQFPLAIRYLKHSVIYRDITTGIDQYRVIAYHKHISVLTDAILSVEKTSLVHVRHQVGTSYRSDIFPAILTGLILNEIIIFIVIIFFVIIIFLNTLFFAATYLNSLIGGGLAVTDADTTACVSRGASFDA